MALQLLTSRLSQTPPTPLPLRLNNSSQKGNQILIGYMHLGPVGYDW